MTQLGGAACDHWGMGNLRFAVTHPLPDAALELLREAGEVRVGDQAGPLPFEELRALVAGVDGIVAMLSSTIDGELADAAGSQLRCVANVAVGYDNVAVEELNERGVVVTNTPGVLDDATADLTIALLLMVTRRLGEAERLIRSGRPWGWGFDFMLGASLRGKTLGVVGMGGIGQAVAARARAFGVEIAYHNRSRLPAEIEGRLGARLLPLEELLATSDFVTLHCPLTPETHHLIDAAALARMKASAFLVNTARGPVVDEQALVNALRSGQIAGAALDVFEHEPEVHPGLTELENTVLIPHLGSATSETREAMAVLAARNVIAVCSGGEALTAVGKFKSALR